MNYLDYTYNILYIIISYIYRSSKPEAMARVEKVVKMLEPPLALSQASVPYITEQLVRRYFVLKQQVQCCMIGSLVSL